MADNSDPQVVVWANERTRTMANRLKFLAQLVDEWLADWTAQTINAQITAWGAGELIADGSDVDGRPRITGTQLVNARAALLQVQTALSVTAVSGVGATVKAIMDGIATTSLS